MKDYKRNKTINYRFFALGGVVVVVCILVLLTSRNADNRIFNVVTVYDTVFVARDSSVGDAVVANKIVGHRSSKVDRNPWRGGGRSKVDGNAGGSGSDRIRHPLAANGENCRVFAKMVAGMFNPYYYTLLDAGAAFAHDADLMYETCRNDTTHTFGVACRWFSECPEDGVEWCCESEIERDGVGAGCPIFLVVGVGGSPDKPATMYVLQAWSLCNVLNRNFLANARKKRMERYFYYKPEGPWLN